MIIGEKAGVPAVAVAPADSPTERVRAAARRGGALRRFDWPLAGSAVALALIGALLVWSATRERSALTGGDPQYFLKRHLLNLGVGLVLAAAVSALDHKRMRALTPAVYLFAVLGLLAVLSPLGSTVNGARSWIELGAGFSIQPAEFAKVGVVMAVAMTLAARPTVRRAPDLLAPVFDPRRPGDVPSARLLSLALLAAAVPMGLIALLPDLGTTMVIVATVVGMIVVSGVRLRVLALLTLAASGGVVAIVKLHLLAAHQVNRFAAFADPNLDPQGVGYNTHQARLAIGSGGIFGQGLFHGAQTNGQFVPEQQTDFVFTVAGEELGLVGGLLIIALFAVLLWRACTIARLATEPFPLLLAAGVLCWFTFQTFENIGMTLGIMPVAGIPLPFVSYGGSSMFANFIAVGLLENVRLRSTR
ncbi:MAG TPA: rod shape-determining protein RodA [Actinocrinis sp.]|uniref:rod shape-determining protein RodA n=1 Tax=Actinocrinis sp. TaxID=1920516 RepID=UPI002D50CA4A|nr:rod shape-determining protein RodA [Actinocrinis sp.]HZU57291.1 rod shape-determining protein RodA [Actinocrinis sp.]